ncbi:adenylate kinase [Thermotoga sp. KOL6]|uniref:adenylate kinase n=1 Tax=Thermotoga sp. KOL6 TaxID=126741 RepID=UPI000C783FDB|nr:adenylate kinase [Thermotoga sp. KOL6]PLV60210.1 adenylate kinase [Thermotoga sp. KOL6]
MMAYLVFLGPPGAGKGTYAKRIQEITGIPHISTGDIFREIVKKENDELGKKIKEIMERGELVPDELVNEVVKRRLSEKDCEKGFILDGYPRTVAQAQFLEDFLDSQEKKITAAILFEVPEEVVVQRLTSRRICPKCGRIYNLLSLPPKEDELCDDCKVKLIQRDDDKEETVRHRYKVYLEKTEPVIEYYENKGLLKRVDGTIGIDNVVSKVLEIIRWSGK